MFHSIPFSGHRGVRHYPRLVTGVGAPTHVLVPTLSISATGPGVEDALPPLGMSFCASHGERFQACAVTLVPARSSSY